ncbi:hypothetical protein BJY01DRAFT_235670 [Aspergillus pseudoustus]|uniref:Amidohydrolase-related domain-containing protein n=1 Tax=Aspergillus pseudoustus TaxID=1810923 RepID=A0ABR4JWE5_9EURO
MLALLFSFIALAATPIACGVPDNLQRRDLVKTAIKNVHVWNGSRFGPESTVVFINGVLSNASPFQASSVVDGKGGYLLPGLIDAHCHVQACSQLESMRQYGVTTALDMGTFPYASVTACKAPGLTDVRGSGAAGTVNGTSISHFPGFPTNSFIPNPAAAKQFVADRLAEGVDYIKVFLDQLGPDDETLATVVDAAHDAGKLVITHAASYASYQQAVIAKADIPCHTPLDQVIDGSTVASLLANKQAVVPTLIMMESIVNNTHAPYPVYETVAAGSVAATYGGKVPIVVGSDANLSPYTPANPSFGISLHEELQLLVAAGVSPVDAIRGATSLAAATFRLRDRGAIKPGLRADLVLLADDPTIDISNTLSIQKVWIKGVEYDPSS